MRKITIVLAAIAAIAVIGLAGYLAQLGTSSTPSNTSNEVCATQESTPSGAVENPSVTTPPNSSTAEPGTNADGLAEQKSDQAQCGDEADHTGKPGEAPKN